MKNRPFSERLGFARTGLRHCWQSESSFRAHIGFAILATLAMIALRPAPVWWALVGLVVVLVLAFELINSALERLIDHLHPAIHPEIGIVKDMASAAVLLISAGALVVAGAMTVTLF